jgi:hypothetical protein
VLQIFPFLGWLAATTSVILLAALRALGELQGLRFALPAGCFLVAGYLQFFGSSAIETAGGLILQTILAVYLLLRWRMTG